MVCTLEEDCNIAVGAEALYGIVVAVAVVVAVVIVLVMVAVVVAAAAFAIVVEGVDIDAVGYD